MYLVHFCNGYIYARDEPLMNIISGIITSPLSRGLRLSSENNKYVKLNLT